MTAPLRPGQGSGSRPTIIASVDTARAMVREHAPRPRRTRVALDHALGRILLSPVIAMRDQPPFDAAAMDGYALATPLSEGQAVTVIGESQAGRGFMGALDGTTTVRVFTGAPLPVGATRVVMQEDVLRDGQTLRLRHGVAPSQKSHIRRRGSDFHAGDDLLQPGDRLTAWRLALAAAAGAARIDVARRPRVAVVCTGDELVPASGAARDDQVFESNAVALGALIRQWGGMVVCATLRGDDQAELTQALLDLRVDIIVTVGGASVGDYDLIRPALESLHVHWLFEKVDIKPGKPTAFGLLEDGRRVLCLPGNPGSALVCAHLFLKPLIEAASGAQVSSHIKALPCATGLAANGPRETFLRAVVLAGIDGSPVLLPLSDQDCAQVHAFAVTSALIRRRAQAAAVSPGEVCECVWLDQ